MVKGALDAATATVDTANLTVLAALSTALAAILVSPFVTLSVAKRQIRAQTISGNRQAWINSLRDDLAEFLSLVFSLRLKGIPSERFLELAQRLRLVQSRIKLRLNPSEQDHVSLIALVERAVVLAIRANDTDASAAAKASDEIVDLSQSVLKREWERVKAGN
jgi:hypothetical protein